METLDGKGKIERLPILVSGIGGIKLLGVPALPFKSTERAGALISEASYNPIKQWGCEESISGMVFDTTSANTGAQTAACVSIQLH